MSVTGKPFRMFACAVLAVSLVWLLYAYSTWSAESKALATLRATEQNTQAQLAESKSRESYDELTGLYNFEGFMAYMQQNVAASDKKQAWMYITFKSTALGNDLKYINDHFGHIAGRQAMLDFSTDLKAAFPEDKYVLAHMGGSAYLVLDKDFQGKEESVQHIQKLKTLWHDTPWLYDGHCIDHPALSVAVAEIDKTSNLDRVRKELFAANSQSREEALFVYRFLGEEPVMEP